MLNMPWFAESGPFIPAEEINEHTWKLTEGKISIDDTRTYFCEQ